MIKVTKLTKTFGAIAAVDSLSFEIHKGEIVGFLGPNGAGKTTTMRLLTGYLSPDSGSISIGGKTLEDHLHFIQSQIGYLPENNPLYKDMLVSEMFHLSADLKQIPLSKRKTAFDFAVSAVSIDDVFYRPIGELSKGYKQRVGMAVSLMHKPKILIMDEPTEGLDPNQRTEIRSLIKNLAKDRTIILSTHVMQEATAVANRILIINKGKLVADGTPEELTRSGRDEKLIDLELEGSKLVTTLKQLPGVIKLTSHKISGNRYSLQLITNSQSDIRPELSKLIVQHQWTVWKIVEKQHQLEDVFHKLTQ